MLDGARGAGPTVVAVLPGLTDPPEARTVHGVGHRAVHQVDHRVAAGVVMARAAADMWVFSSECTCAIKLVGQRDALTPHLAAHGDPMAAVAAAAVVAGAAAVVEIAAVAGVDPAVLPTPVTAPPVVHPADRTATATVA